MKEIKVIAGLLIVSVLLALVSIKAAGSQSYSNITIPSLSGTYTTGSVRKNTISYQYVKMINAKDSVSGDQRAMEARLKDVSISWKVLVKGSDVKLNHGTGNEGTITGDFKLQLKASRSTLSTTKFWGTWTLDS